MKHITVNTYRKDKYYPRVVKAVGKMLAHADVVAPSDILIEMGNLSKKNYEAWRKGQVPYLERVFEGSLSKANRILRIIGFHVHDLNMVSRQAVYHQWGKGKKRMLRFSKSGDPNIEKAYSRHYYWNQSQQKKQIAINNALPEQGGAVDQGHSGPIKK
ncbi:MAG: hypothetical protein H8D96_10190 [Desulfobacterales bacterium]|uniref:Uncharacterized protein n=1 Tax=Candidatus Desulfatibia vada TaxID=2841696 RepID=A0A8J6TQG4_9BACT|nr:hypothetical protein [Candidatus Desulfatibia vada]MBL6971124.1 hypothetical protein [Desulfobacterales bacterium]